MTSKRDVSRIVLTREGDRWLLRIEAVISKQSVAVVGALIALAGLGVRFALG